MIAYSTAVGPSSAVKKPESRRHFAMMAFLLRGPAQNLSRYERLLPPSWQQLGKEFFASARTAPLRDEQTHLAVPAGSATGHRGPRRVGGGCNLAASQSMRRVRL